MDNLLLFNIFSPEMLVIFFAILLLFGGRKIPELMRGIGKGIREFNAARHSLESEFKEGQKDADRKLLEKRQQELNQEDQIQKLQEQLKQLQEQQNAGTQTKSDA